MSDLVFNGPAEFQMEVFVINDDDHAIGRATIGLGTFEYPSKEKVAERISKFESEEMPKGFRLMTKTESWEMVMLEKTGTSFAMAGNKDWDHIKPQSDNVACRMPEGTIIKDQDGNVLDWEIVDGVVEVNTMILPNLSVGDMVDYHAIANGPITSMGHTVREIHYEPNNFGCVVAFITGKAGCVDVAHLSKTPPPGSEG